jgi:hypothetical protein
MNPGLDYYRLGGRPASASIVFNRVPQGAAPSLHITIGSDTYTWKPPGSITTPDFVGTTPQELAISLCASINAQQNRSDIAPSALGSTPIKDYYAIYYGNLVALVACVPGTGGNSLALTTSNSDTGCVSLSGSTFAGGTAAP